MVNCDYQHIKRDKAKLKMLHCRCYYLHVSTGIYLMSLVAFLLTELSQFIEKIIYLSTQAKERIPVGARFSAPGQTGPDAHPAYSTMVTGSLPGVRQLGSGVDHPPHLVSKFKEQLSYASTPPVWAFLAYCKVHFTFSHMQGNTFRIWQQVILHLNVLITVLRINCKQWKRSMDRYSFQNYDSKSRIHRTYST